MRSTLPGYKWSRIKNMDENTNAEVQQDIVEDTNETPQVETESQEEVDTTQEVEQNEPISSEGQPKESVSHKPTRAERRIQKLSSRVKELSERQTPPNTDVFGNNLPPWWGNQNQVSEDGTMTIDQLNRQIMTVAQLAVAKDRQQQKFVSTVESHQSQLEEVAKAPEFGNKTFDDKFTKLYQTMNYDETGAFKPKMTPKELYEAMKGTVELGKSSGASEAATNMARTIANSAVTPSARRDEDPDRAKKEKFVKASQSGSTEAWADYLKDLI